MTESEWVDMIDLAALAFGALILPLLPIELWYYWRRGELKRSRVVEMLASLSPLVPTLLTGGIVAAFITGLYGFVGRLAPWHIPVTWWSALVALMLVDFLYYVDHRVGHENRTYWAIAHSVHHSSPQFDQTTGLRISFVDGFFSTWFYLPAILVGFDPYLVGACFVLVIAYQQWIHTELVGKLPRLDGWLNTPSNHRVHHAVQRQYQDRNFGGILMVWDRIFGTYAHEDEPVRYGVTHPIGSSNPIAVHLHEARALWRDLRATPRWRDRLARLWHAPDWGPDA